MLMCVLDFNSCENLKSLPVNLSTEAILLSESRTKTLLARPLPALAPSRKSISELVRAESLVSFTAVTSAPAPSSLLSSAAFEVTAVEPSFSLPSATIKSRSDATPISEAWLKVA